MWPPPVPTADERTVSPAGAVSAVAVVDLSAQSDTTQLPSAGTTTRGVVCAVRVTVSWSTTKALTGPDASVPWYARTATCHFTKLGDVRVTVRPASAGPATRCHTVEVRLPSTC